MTDEKQQPEGKGTPVPEDSSSSSPMAAEWMFLQPGILDLMHDAVIVSDLRGDITGCNKAAERMFGYPAPDLIHKNVSVFYPEEERHMFYQQVIPAVFEAGEFQGEVRNRTSSGEYIYVHLSVAALKDGDGRPAGMIGFAVDVTAQKLGGLAVKRNQEMEEKLSEERESTEFFRTLKEAVERSNDVVLITAAEATGAPGPRIVYVNPAFERMTGYAAEDVIGKTPRILQGPKTDRNALDRIRKALKSWEPIREEIVNYRKDGSEFTVELSIVPVANEAGLYSYWFAIQRETTEQYLVREQLAESELKLRTLVEAVPQYLWISDAAGRREWVSESFAAFVGARSSELLGDGWVRYVHPDDRDEALARLELNRKQRSVCTAELRLRQHSGEYLWFLKQAAPQIGSDGNVQKWIGSFTDISDRKEIEAALRTSEERAHLGISVARLALAEIDYLTGISHLSAEAAQLFGLGNESVSVPRHTVHATFYPDDLPELMRRIAACLDPNGAGWFEMDHRVTLPSGKVRWLRVRKQISFHGEGHSRHPVRAMLAAIDVTEAKEAELEIKASEKRFRDLAESLPQFVWVTDTWGRKTYCNQRYLEYTGIPTCDLMDQNWLACIHPEEREAAANGWTKAVATRTPYLQEYRLRRHDGEYRHFLARAIPVTGADGQIERWLGSSTDVHERRMTEETLRRAEKLAVVGRMASSISHEINNPLAGVVNLLYLMEGNRSADADLRNLIRTAQEQLARVTEITTQSLLFHRQSSKAALLPVGEAVDAILSLQRLNLQARQIQIMRGDRVTPALRCMAGDIRQAIAHVINNALDAVEQGGTLAIRVRGVTCRQGNPRKGVRITIADDGTGIPADNLALVFDAFYSTKGMTSTGLGLWIARSIIERHRGTIRVKSSTSKNHSGSVFQIFLPYPTVPS